MENRTDLHLNPFSHPPSQTVRSVTTFAELISCLWYAENHQAEPVQGSLVLVSPCFLDGFHSHPGLVGGQ